MEGPRQKLVRVVLDGTVYAGKSVLVICLKTGRYEIVPATIGASRVLYEAMINQVQYRAEICDTNGLTRSVYVDNLIYYRRADVFIEFFDISSLSSLEESIHIRIPYFRRRFPEVPILLVGTKADLRGTENTDLFPVELGPFFARYAGAVKYMECSAKTNFNVHEVFKEAIVCYLNKSNLEVIDIYLYTLKNMKLRSEEGSQWTQCLYDSYLRQEIAKKGVDKRYFEKDINLVEEEIRKARGLRVEIFAYHFLEFDKLQISHGLPATHFNVDGTISPPTCTLWCLHNCFTDTADIIQCYLFNLVEPYQNVVCSRCPANLRFFANECKSISRFLVNTRDQVKVRSLIIVNCFGKLEFSFLTNLTGLEYLAIVNTDVDLATLTFPPHLQDTMKHLVLNNCGITQATDVPPEIGNLVNLQILNLANNNFKKIPTTLGFLDQLHTLLIDHDQVLFPPRGVLKRPVHEILSYLKELEENPVENTKSKLIIVGQEGVGKSTLVKAMKRSLWLTKNEPPPKTDGVDISELTLQDIQCKVYDLAGDVEYLNTHSLFLSSNTLHLVVFDLSRVIVDKEARSADHLCRLELWLETIASRDPRSKAIVVGTHADHSLGNEHLLDKSRKLLAEVLFKHCSSHKALCRTEAFEECFICNPEKCSENLENLKSLMTADPSNEDRADTLDPSCSQIPHILGYFEVSGIKNYPHSLLNFHNINLEELKSLIGSSICNLMKVTGTNKIPRRWLSFREVIAQKLLSDDDLKRQPLMPLSRVRHIAQELEIFREKSVIAMLRFFHCQGTYLWYEDLPEMKDIVILDPQWLSNQLRTLISHRSSVGSICNGVLHLSELSKVWGAMSEDNRRNLLALFRSVGLCFSISDTEKLFPYNVPIGWPDRVMWPPLPQGEENQTSLLFKFSFIPPSFFPDLTVEVNKQNAETFARNVKPMYYRFHIVYIIKDTDSLSDAYGEENTSPNDCKDSQHPPVLHKVHYELTPYNNSLIVKVRGPDPPSIIPDIRSTIETVKRRRYPGITYTKKMLCPKCVMERVQHPDSFVYDNPHDGVCSLGHIVGSKQTILQGRYRSAEIVPTAVAQTSRVVGETLEDHFCPKLFVVLPINLHSDLSLKDRFVYSYIRDGFAVHLLCECPGQWHFVDSPGFRVGKPKEFFEKYGTRVCKVLRFISTLSTPIKAAAALDPHCKAAAAVGAGAKSASQELESLLDSYLDKYPRLKPTLGSSKDDLKELKSSSGLQRSELSRFLELEAKGRNFGPLVCTYVDKRDEWLWLCEEHNERFEIVEREVEND